MIQNSIVIGLTGGIGTGKSTVSRILKKSGFLIIDADKIARQIVKPGEAALEEIKKVFGDNIVDEDGELKRKDLGDIVFRDKSELQKLNNITSKYIVEEIDRQILNAKVNIKAKYIIIDAAILFEMHLEKKCDIIFGVNCSKDVQVERIMVRNNLTYKQALDRVESQVPNKILLKKCDYIIQNDYSLEELHETIKKLIKEVNMRF